MFRFLISWEVAEAFGPGGITWVQHSLSLWRELQHRCSTTAAVDGNLFQVVVVGGRSQNDAPNGEILHTSKETWCFLVQWLFPESPAGWERDEIWKPSDRQRLITWPATLSGYKFPDEMMRLPTELTSRLQSSVEPLQYFEHGLMLTFMIASI